MNNFAYLTQGTDTTIMHIVPKKEMAVKSKELGNIIETDIPEQGGHALVFYDGKEQTIIVYSDTLMKTEAKGKAIKDADKLFPKLAELYKKCKG